MSEQGDAYTAFIDLELSREYDRRDKINSQAGAIVTATGALLTVATGLLAFAKGATFSPDGAAGGTLVAALVLYLLSGALAQLAGNSRTYQVVAVPTMGLMLTTHWTDSEITAKNFVARAKLQTLATLRAGNNTKADRLRLAVSTQLLAVALVAVGVYLAVT